MALSIAVLEAHLGRFLRQAPTHLDPEVLANVVDALAAAIANGGKNYVLHGTIGTLAERREAMTTALKALYRLAVSGAPDPDDGARGQHGFEMHWLPAKERGE